MNGEAAGGREMTERAQCTVLKNSSKPALDFLRLQQEEAGMESMQSFILLCESSVSLVDMIFRDEGYSLREVRVRVSRKGEP